MMSDTKRESATAGVEGYDPHAYPPFAYTADIAVMTIRNGQLSILLIERGAEPFKGQWALPGGFVGIDESSEEAARRELQEEAGLAFDGGHFEQLATYSTPGRDPRMRVISTAYLVFLPDIPVPHAGDDAAVAHFFAVDDILNGEVPLAFDHDRIVRDAVERTRSKIEYTPLATSFIEHPFTMGDLRRVYETVWNTRLHAANFARKAQTTPGFVTETGGKGASQFEGGRSAKLYTPGTATLLHPAILRPQDTEEMSS